MRPHDSELTPNCQNALQAIESDPLNPPQSVLEHVSTCPMCSEARVMWLAQEDFDHPTTPAGYFDRLPTRVFQKLPTPSTRLSLRTPLLITAASIMFIAAASGYWFGRHGQSSQIILEAVIPPRDIQDPLQDPTSFSSLELFALVPTLTLEETQAMMEDLKKPEASLQPTKPER